MMNLVKVLSSEIDDLSRRVIKFLRLGRDDFQTSIESCPFGIDSNPVSDLVAVYSHTQEQGKTVIVGYLNKNQLSDVGETRLFSTDENGDIQNYIWLRNNGIIEIGGDSDFMVRYSVLKEEYDKTRESLDAIMSVLSGSPINEAGNGAPSSLQAALSASLVGKSTGDISGSKIDEVKTL